jgi:hypothetical protein
MALMLIEYGAWLDKTDGYGKSAIHYAKSGILKIVLLGRGAEAYKQAWSFYRANLEAGMLIPDLIPLILSKLFFC